MRSPMIKKLSLRLKGHCHGDFSVFCSKLLKYLTRYLFSNIKLLLEERKNKIFSCLFCLAISPNKLLNLKKLVIFFKF